VTLLGSGDGARARELSREPGFASVLEHFDAPATAIADLQALYAETPSADPQFIAAFAAYFGDQQLAFEALRDYVRGLRVGAHLMWRPLFREVRQREDFKRFLRDEGFIAYWREFDWPDLCRPVGSDDFECD
jgi:hypothetical protein